MGFTASSFRIFPDPGSESVPGPAAEALSPEPPAKERARQIERAGGQPREMGKAARRARGKCRVDFAISTSPREVLVFRSSRDVFAPFFPFLRESARPRVAWCPLQLALVPPGLQPCSWSCNGHGHEWGFGRGQGPLTSLPGPRNVIAGFGSPAGSLSTTHAGKEAV